MTHYPIISLSFYNKEDVLISFILIFVSFSFYFHSLIFQFPSYIFFSMYFIMSAGLAFLSLYINIYNYKKYLFILIVLACSLATIHRTGLPYSIPSIFPDANFVSQLLYFYTSENKIIIGVGVNQAYYYSYFPLFETLLLQLHIISALDLSLILSTFSITFLFPVIFLHVLVLYMRLNRRKGIALFSAFVAVTSFYATTLFSQPVHPAFSIIFFLHALIIVLGNLEKGKLLLPLVTLSLVTSHNTFSLLLLLILVLIIVFFKLLSTLKLSDLKHNVTYNTVFNNFKTFIRNTKYLIYSLFTSIFFYHTYISLNFSSRYIFSTLIDLILLAAINPQDPFRFFVASYEPYMHSSSYVGYLLARSSNYIGMLSVSFYLVVLLVILAENTLLNRFSNSLERNVLDVCLILVSFSILIAVSPLWLFTHRNRDFYFRFFVFVYLLTTPAAVGWIMKKFKNNNNVSFSFIFVIVLQSLLFQKAYFMYGYDTPTEIGDVRLGPTQAFFISKFLRTFSQSSFITGTRIVYNIVAPLSGLLFSFFSLNLLESPSLIILNNIEIFIQKNLLFLSSTFHNQLLSTDDFFLMLFLGY